MKNQKLTYFIFLFFIFFIGYGQDFELIEVKGNMARDTIGIYPTFENYQFQEFCFVIGTDPESENKYDLRLLVFDSDTNLIYKSDGQADSVTFTLNFFQSKTDPNLSLILAHSSNEYSWGNDVFRFKADQIEHLGLLDVAKLEQYDEPWDISTYTKIYKNGKNLRFEFETDSIVFNPGGRKENILLSADIYYIWDGQKLELKNNR